MPGIDELQWREYVDFTGGLWERGNDRECAPNGLLECTDCFPQPSGGLKAFAQFQPSTNPFTAGQAPTTEAWPIAVLLGGFIDSPELFVLCAEDFASATFTIRLLTNPGRTLGLLFPDASSCDWTTNRTWTSSWSFSTQVRMVSYGAGGNVFGFFNFPQSLSSGTTNNGVWRTNSTGATLAFRTPGFGTTNPNPNPGPHGLWVHQNRLVFLHQEPSNNGPTNSAIWYTDPGSTAQPSTANYVSPHGVAGTFIFAHPFAPSDLYLHGKTVPFETIQGPLTTPTVRDLSYGRYSPRSYPVSTTIGLVMVLASVGAYVWDGNQLQHISPSIDGDPMGGLPGAYGPESSAESEADLTGLPQNPQIPSIGLINNISGQLGSWEHWVLFNRGYVLDTRTLAWFKQTSAPVRYWVPVPSNGLMIGSSNTSFVVDGNRKANRPFIYFSQMSESEWTPSSTYSFTLPLLFAPGQKTNVREIEYHINTFNDTSSVEVELSWMDSNGQIQTKTQGPYVLPSAAPHRVRVVVGGQPADWWKIRTIMKSNRSGVSAPTLERMFCGTQAATRYEAAS